MKHWQRSRNTDYTHHWLGIGANDEYMSFIAKDIDSGSYYVMIEFSTHGASFTLAVGHESLEETAATRQREWLKNHDPIEPGDFEGYMGM